MIALGACERILNRHIAESTAAQQRIATLEGRTFAIEIEGLALRIVLRAAGGRVVLAVDRELAADATLNGAPLDLLRLLRSSGITELRAGRAKLGGSVEVAEGFADALRLARPDVEAELALWIGDIAAHELAQAGRATLAWLGSAGRALEADLAEYLQEEQPWLPAAAEARGLFADVERLRDDVERLAQRVDKLARVAATGR